MKKKLIIIIAAALVVVIGTVSIIAFGGKKGDNRIEIVVDGGGIAGNYNSSINQTVSAANPNPYNYLEKLAEEWNAKNDTYKIKWLCYN